ncbi:nucleoside-diphosphate sugar epimerase/dehydratase [Bowmanella denitrificans]|uniref:Nucleoside-diphosphate sugar epimerase/dehydratase n=1 Tax=Bowmanella denitrificans TaxID=366582 RepID=A0ABN0X3P2_9ALTE
MKNLIQHFFEIPRIYKRLITLLFDVVFIASAMVLALYIRVGFEGAKAYLDKETLWLMSALIPLTLVLWIRLGLYRAVIRYLDVKVLSNIFWGSVGSVAVLVFLSFTIRADLPRSIPFIYFTLILIFVAGSRLFVRGLINAQGSQTRKPVAIYGAGSAGRQLCLSLQNGAEYRPVVFIDDSSQLQGTTVADVKVFSPEYLPELVKKYQIDKVLFAIPSASSRQQKDIFNRVQALHIEMLTIPGTADLVSGKVSVNQLRTVEIQDLLGREPVAPNTELLNKCNLAKCVLVTGAGGSIGSELCRQIVALKPQKLVLLEQSEFNLYAIEKELRELAPGLKIVPILGSVQDPALVDGVLGSYQIQTIYHAAAYKHVPLVEFNVVAGIRNNIWGTKTVAEAALRHQVEHFVLVSTDKAVRPTNVMGTTKRTAELVIQDLAKRSGSTVFSMVRFGNVLGSSGSVVPLFRKQIEQGGPVTVTHPDITRYFMTIPEAASLVIQAGAMAKGGEVFVLDMGQPVKIVEMAEKMIHLMGYDVRSEANPEGDIAIEFTGLRPGEKLYEELLIGGEVEGTGHPRIMRAREDSMGERDLNDLLAHLEKQITTGNIQAIRELLEKAPTGFHPITPVADLLWCHGRGESKSQEEVRLKLV